MICGAHMGPTNFNYFVCSWPVGLQFLCFLGIELSRKRHIKAIWGEDLVKLTVDATSAKTDFQTAEGSRLHLF